MPTYVNQMSLDVCFFSYINGAQCVAQAGVGEWLHSNC
jgi:hypothetical protein